MSETPTSYQTDQGLVSSEPHNIIREISEHYAMVPDDLVRSGKPSALMVYSALDRIARGTKTETSTAISYLAQFTGLSGRTVKTALKWLEEHGFIEVEHAGAGRESNRYFLPFRNGRGVKSTPDMGKNYPSEMGKNYPQTNSINQKSEPTVLPEDSSAIATESSGAQSSFLPRKSSEPTKPAKEKPKPDPRVSQIRDQLVEIRGYKSSRAGAEAAATKRMLQDYTPEEILSCYRYLKSEPFWRQKPLFLNTVESQIGEWKVNGCQRQHREPDSPGHREETRPAANSAFANIGISSDELDARRRAREANGTPAKTG